MARTVFPVFLDSSPTLRRASCSADTCGCTAVSPCCLSAVCPVAPPQKPNPYVCVRLFSLGRPVKVIASTWIHSILFSTGALAYMRWIGAALLAVGIGSGCAHAPAVGRGGPVYAVTVESVNGRHTSAQGHLSLSAMAIQVGD